jgi:hypothetical protein
MQNAGASLSSRIGEQGTAYRQLHLVSFHAQELWLGRNRISLVQNISHLTRLKRISIQVCAQSKGCLHCALTR